MCRLKLCDQIGKEASSTELGTTLAIEASEDCQNSLDILNTTISPGNRNNDKIASLRSKVLFRRAKAFFLQTTFLLETTNRTTNTTTQVNKLLNDAAKDLLDVLSIDSKNKQASILLRKVREKHSSTVKKSTPLDQALSALHSTSSNSLEEQYDHLKVIYGTLCTQDTMTSFIELGRKDGVSILYEILASSKNRNKEEEIKSSCKKEKKQSELFAKSNAMVLQILSLCCSSSAFVHKYMMLQFDQTVLLHLLESFDGNDETQDHSKDVIIAIISLILRIVVALHKDAEIGDLTKEENQAEYTDKYVNGHVISQILLSVFSTKSQNEESVKLAALDLLSAWTSHDWQGVSMSINSSLALSTSESVSGNEKKNHKNNELTEDEIRSLPPRQFAKYRKYQYDSMIHRKKVASQNVLKFLDSEKGLGILLNACIPSNEQNSSRKATLKNSSSNRRVRKEIELVISRMLHILMDEDNYISDEKTEKEGSKSKSNHTDGKDVPDSQGQIIVKELVRSLLGLDNKTFHDSNIHQTGGVIIEEINEDDKHEEKNEDFHEKLELQMMQGQLTSCLLLSNADIGHWAISLLVKDMSFFPSLILSENTDAMSIASELISVCASIEKCRSLLNPIISSDYFDKYLLRNENSDIQSGAASAIAKIGLASKGIEGIDGLDQVMGLLQVAVDLLFEETTDYDNKEEKRKNNVPTNHHHSASSSAAERGIELLNYLASKTIVKEEIAHGYKTSTNKHKTALEKLVEISCSIEQDTTHMESSSSSSSTSDITCYGLASIFSQIAVTLDTLRREAFIGKDITHEQYQQLQNLGKTEEEKEFTKEKEEIEDDSSKQVEERIRKMANANIPTAMVKLLNVCDGYKQNKGPQHENTMEQLLIGMERMATETSVRGTMIQQGCLSACIKFEDGVSSYKVKKAYLHYFYLSFSSSLLTSNFFFPLFLFLQEQASEKRKLIIRHARHCISKLLVTTNPNLLTNSQRLGSILPLLKLVNDHDASDLCKFEALLSITNLGSVQGMETKNKIVNSKGLNILNYAMFSDHEMVRRAATEAISNLVPHKKTLELLGDSEKVRLWVGFASDFEENFECSRAAIGCLAMATSYDIKVCHALIKCKHFEQTLKLLLECGNLELMHRVLVVIYNLLACEESERQERSPCRECVIKSGSLAFCQAYVQTYCPGGKMVDMEDVELDFDEKDTELMRTTVELSMEIVSNFA